MKSMNAFAVTLLSLCLFACSGIETQTWPPEKFAAGNFKTYSWRTEPIRNMAGSGDPIYKVDPLIRRETDAILQQKGYRRIPRKGDFTIDYLFAPGLAIGASAETADNLNPRAGVRPNTNISQAERDNAVALGSGVRETRRIALQVNDGKSGLEIWRGVITEFVENVNQVDKAALERAVRNGVKAILKELPPAQTQAL